MLKREQCKRMVLYGMTVLAWLSAAAFAATSLAWDDLADSLRTVLVFVLTIAASLTTASLFAVFVVPLQVVYRSGYEDGQQASQCTAFRPDMQMIAGGRRKTDVQLGTVSKVPSRN